MDGKAERQKKRLTNRKGMVSLWGVHNETELDKAKASISSQEREKKD
jgi:hypothetical protein